MMASQQFCLKWNNHHSNLVTVFGDLFSNEDYVDVTLACDGVTMKAHKMVLSACSPFFQDIFKNNPCQHPIVILKNIKHQEMKAIMQFMYKGEVNVTQDQLSELLKTAEELQIRGLAEVANENSFELSSGPSSSKRKKSRNNNSSHSTNANIHKKVPSINKSQSANHINPSSQTNTNSSSPISQFPMSHVSADDDTSGDAKSNADEQEHGYDPIQIGNNDVKPESPNHSIDIATDPISFPNHTNDSMNNSDTEGDKLHDSDSSYNIKIKTEDDNLQYNPDAVDDLALSYMDSSTNSQLEDTLSPGPSSILNSSEIRSSKAQYTENPQISPKSTWKYPRRHITLEEKSKILKFSQEGESVSNMATLLNLQPSSIKSVIKCDEKIKSGRLKFKLIKEMENLLCDWIEEEKQRLGNSSLSEHIIMEKAKVIFRNLQFQNGVLPSTFKTTTKWFKEFKSRQNLMDFNN